MNYTEFKEKVMTLNDSKWGEYELIVENIGANVCVLHKKLGIIAKVSMVERYNLDIRINQSPKEEASLKKEAKIFLYKWCTNLAETPLDKREEDLYIVPVYTKDGNMGYMAKRDTGSLYTTYGEFLWTRKDISYYHLELLSKKVDFSEKE